MLHEGATANDLIGSYKVRRASDAAGAFPGRLGPKARRRSGFCLSWAAGQRHQPLNNMQQKGPECAPEGAADHDHRDEEDKRPYLACDSVAGISELAEVPKSCRPAGQTATASPQGRGGFPDLSQARLHTRDLRGGPLALQRGTQSPHRLGCGSRTPTIADLLLSPVYCVAGRSAALGHSY